MLTTERLILRPIVMEDARDIYEYSKNENIGSNAGWKPHETLEETKEIMESVFIGQENVFGIVLRGTGKMIGSIGLIPDPKRENPGVRMLGYSLSEEHWGRGIMTEAARELVRYGLEDLKLELISAYCYPHNERSKAVIRKCGFVYEGTLKRCEKMYHGQVYDNECYACVSKKYTD